MTDQALDALLRLNAVPFVKPEQLHRLLDAHAPEEALRLSAAGVAAAAGCEPEKAQRIVETARAFDADAERAECERRGIALLTREDPRWPAALSDLGEETPALLYAWGAANAQPLSAAVVGTRDASPYGLRLARRLAHDLAAAGVCVVSGLARGVDTAAHEGALAAGGVTWAVLGSGLSRLYPPENEPLALRIAGAGGCLLSEHPLQGLPDQSHFPRRNRLLAALSQATVVVESRDLKPRGAMDTAARARALGRDLFAVPGPADAPCSAGPLKLLKEGAAALMTEARDLLDLLPPDLRLAAVCRVGAPRRAAASPSGAASLSLEYSKILQLLDNDTWTADQLARETGLDVPRLSNILFELELQGLIIAVPGQRYAKKDKSGS